MKSTNISNLRAHLNEIIQHVMDGEEIEIQKHNVAVAKLVPLKRKINKTKLNSAKGSIKILGDLTEPLIAEEDWDMLKR